MKTVNVVAAIIEQDGKVLGTQRGYGELAGSWEFPGGKVEEGETPEEALVREIKEELDADITVGRLIATVDYDYEKFHLHMRCFLAHLAHGRPRLLEHSAAAWLDADTIGTVDWLPADIEVVEAIMHQGILDARP